MQTQIVALIGARDTSPNVTNQVGLIEGNARAAVLGTGTVGDATVGRPIFGRNFILSIEKKF